MEWCSPLHLGVVAIEKGAFGLPSTMIANFTYLLLGSCFDRDVLDIHFRSFKSSIINTNRKIVLLIKFSASFCSDFLSVCDL